MIKPGAPFGDIAAGTLGGEEEKDAFVPVSFNKCFDQRNLALSASAAANGDTPQPQDHSADHRHLAPAFFDRKIDLYVKENRGTERVKNIPVRGMWCGDRHARTLWRLGNGTPAGEFEPE